MRQIIPYSSGPLLNASAVTIGGLNTHAVAIGVVVNTAAVLGVHRAALDLANNNYEAGKATLKQRHLALRGSTGSAKKFCTLFRELLKPQLGPRHSEVWDQTGFIGRLAIPRKPAQLAPLLLAAKAYLTANVSAQKENLNITPERAGELEQLLVNEQTAVNLQETEVQRLKGLRDEAADKLRNRLCALVEELGRLIGPMDERWLALGFNRPGQKKRPDAPTKLVHVLAGNTAVSVKWAPTPRADYYRVWKRVVGSEDALTPVGSPADTDFILEDLPANSEIEIAVSAVNNGGESALSEVIKVKTS